MLHGLKPDVVVNSQAQDGWGIEGCPEPAKTRQWLMPCNLLFSSFRFWTALHAAALFKACVVLKGIFGGVIQYLVAFMLSSNPSAARTTHNCLQLR